MDDEMVTTPEDRAYMANRLAEDFEREQATSIDELISSGTLDRDAVVRLIAEGMERIERYIITS